MNNYRENSWEWAAYRAATRYEIGMPTEITTTYRELFESGMIPILARVAWTELENNATGWSLDDQIRLMAGKQHDYGHGNILKFGRRGVEVRLWDKIARYDNLVRRGVDPENETLNDTLVDIVGYVIIWLMLGDNTFTMPLADDL